MASEMKVPLNQLGEAISDIITEYTDEVVRDLPEIMKDAGKECVKELKSAAASAGFGGSKYKKSFRSKVTSESSSEVEVTVYSSKYQLAHLLEHGHTIRAQKSGQVYGVTRAFPHWAIAEEKAAETVGKKIKMKLEGTS